MARLVASTVNGRNAERDLLSREIARVATRKPISFTEAEEARRRVVRERKLAAGAVVTHEYDEAFRGTIERITSDGKVYLIGRPNQHIHPAMLRRI